MSTNRNPIKNWSLTFPQSGKLKQDEFANSLPPFDEIFVAQEEHKNGGLHLHAGVKLTKGLSFNKLKLWLQKKYPDDWKRIKWEAIRSLSHWEDYCNKEDPEAYKIVRNRNMERSQKMIAKIKQDWLKMGINLETFEYSTPTIQPWEIEIAKDQIQRFQKEMSSCHMV